MPRIWKVAILGVAVSVLGIAAVGLVAAQTDGDAVPGSGRLGNFVSRLAENLGISEKELEGALDQTQLDLIDDALAEGRLDEDRAAKARERIESGEGRGFFGGGFRNGDFGHSFDSSDFFSGGFGGEGFGHSFGMGASFDELAEFLGVESSVITDGLEAGQSLAEIAEANGKSRDELKSFLVAQFEEMLSGLDGKFGGKFETAPDMIDTIIDAIIDGEGFPFKGGSDGFHGGFRGGFPGHFGPKGDDKGDAPAEGTSF